MSYVGVEPDYRNEVVLVWERHSPEQRVLIKKPMPFYFYVLDENGERESIFGERVTKVEAKTREGFDDLLRQYKTGRHESDIAPHFKVLMNEYYQATPPPMTFAFCDIEADVVQSLGWTTVENPYAPINAVTVYQSWTGRYKTLVRPPNGYDIANFMDELGQAAEQLGADAVELLKLTDITLCKSEEELLRGLVEAIQNADIISGWNSEFFDLPYIIRRLERVAPKLLPKMSFIGARPPRAEVGTRFGDQVTTYKIFGRSHIDYLALFKKFAQDVKYPSYSLGHVGQEEVGAPKVHFDESFEEFYNKRFATFTIYNIRDVEILVKIDKKRKLMRLVNVMAHENTCMYENLLGTVRHIETAMVNRAHNVHNQVVRDKVKRDATGPVDGALVLDPVPGLHEWLGSVDLNSLYPSVQRTVNISPEMMIGQFISGNCSDELRTNGDRFAPIRNESLPEWKQRLVAINFDRKNPYGEPEIGMPTPGEYDWAGIIASDDLEHTLELTEVGQSRLGTDETHVTLTGQEWIDVFKEQHWSISAFGTVFDQSRGLGVVTKTLESWYAERKKFQAEKKKAENELAKLIEATPVIHASEALLKKIKQHGL